MASIINNRMSLDRKSFLEVAITGGLGVLFGGATLAGNRWKERGVQLVSVRRSSLNMGSIIQFEVVAEQEKDGYEAIRKGVAVFRELDKKLSMYDPDSEMGKLSRNAGGEPVTVSKDTMTVLDFAKKIWRRTGGRFDITIEPAMRKWGFRRDPGIEISRPSDHELKQLEQVIGSDKLILNDNTVLLEQPGMAVDLGGIAGGYALDRAIEEMKKADIAAAFINFSGDIHCFGNPMGEDGWPVYILNPRTKEPVTEPVILRDEALSTSGAYQNRRKERNGNSWGHLLFPGEGKPFENMASITAIHASAMVADAWSTAGYVGAELPDDIRWKIL